MDLNEIDHVEAELSTTESSLDADEATTVKSELDLIVAVTFGTSDKETTETDSIETTTSLGEIQYDDDDDYGDDTFFDSCNYNGSVYENFQDAPSGDPCQQKMLIQNNWFKQYVTQTLEQQQSDIQYLKDNCVCKTRHNQCTNNE